MDWTDLNGDYDEALRACALELAQRGMTEDNRPADVIARARLYLEFVTGRVVAVPGAER